MACAPPNLEESFFETMYARGDFDQEHEDIQNLAACFYHRIDLPSEMKKIWPRYTEKRYQAAKNSIWAKVQKKMPPWAKKFFRIWDKLSESQSEASKLEWFYEEVEKPTQEENAKKVGISIASYQERLGWAYILSSLGVDARIQTSINRNRTQNLFMKFSHLEKKS